MGASPTLRSSDIDPISDRMSGNIVDSTCKGKNKIEQNREEQDKIHSDGSKKLNG